MRKKIVLKSMLTAAMAMSVLFSAVGTNTAFAAGGEIVSFNITADLICKEYSNGLPKDLDKDLGDKIVIVSTNDIHGAVNDLTYVSQLRNRLKEKNANVLLVDSGDFSTDKKTVENYDGKKSDDAGFCASNTEGIAPVKIMNAVGYDYGCLGNHEFERGKANATAIIKAIKHKIVDANLESSGNSTELAKRAIANVDGVKIGFFGLDSLENHAWYPNFDYKVNKDAKALHNTARTQVNELKKEGADIVIGLTHLGVDDEPANWATKDSDKVKNAIKPNTNDKKVNKYDYLYPEGIRSVDLFADVDGIDLLLDGHSHTTMTGSEYFKDVNVQSNGIWLRNIGVVVIGNTNGKYEIEQRFLIPEEYYDKIGEDPKITDYINYVIKASETPMTAEEAMKSIEDYDPNKDYSADSSKTSRKSKQEKASAADDSSSIEASLPENELEATEAASSASIENEDAANTASSEDEANIEESTEETSSDDSSNEKSNDKSGKTGDHHRERHHHRNYKHGFGG
ncbi:hypothetical protein D6856_14355 [Butyrivibrio sp. XB500-5]|uniref:metallophosphoesterase n=1 Tax=Butyrivibrio sp. XB500-5 TaxID=2364880 RepID=UPI000EA91542|nr:metallophosphoesterase [Butyrivibrio sp. XB500-5]RKM56955.1 hypothetical protein D6856_14355 [Butyrivibrio sp. XB500-5]